MRCPICAVRVGPCLDDAGQPMAQHHVPRVLGEAKRRVDHNHAAEATRLRAAQKESGR